MDSASPSPDEDENEFGFAYAVEEPPARGETSMTWEAVRANWTRKPPGGVTMPASDVAGGKAAALKLVVENKSATTPIALEHVVACLLQKWEDDDEEAGI